MRTHAAKRIEVREVTQRIGEVARIDGDAFVVRTDGVERSARRAASCLLTPEPGDRVLVLLHDQGAHVLAVLDRVARTAATLAAPNGLNVKAAAGKIKLAAADGVELVSGGSVDVVASGLGVHVGEGHVVAERFSFLGSFVRAEVEKLKVFADTCDQVFERVSQRVRRAYRFVSEFEQLRAGAIDYEAKGTARVHSHDTVMTADQLVKIDGEQIHLG